MKILLKGGSVVSAGKLRKVDIFIEDGKITKLKSSITKKADEVIDITGKTVMSGFVDMHTHLREPGFEGKETILTGSTGAVKGGYTDICCMPNTNPVTDNKTVVEYIKNKAKEADKANVHVIGAISKGQKGEELSEIGSMKECGIVAVSDDGRPVENANLMKLAMQYASDFGLLVLSHCEDMSLTNGGVVNEGKNSFTTGLKGINRASEEVMVAREIVLSDALNIPVHICHISTKGSVALVRDAKKRGVKVSCETCPHYFYANDDYILNYSPMSKVNPPLREEEDRLAIIEGIKDGTIDVISTDHAPHTASDKAGDYYSASFGISGIETAFSLAVTTLYKNNIVNIVKLNELMSTKASKLLNINSNEIVEGNNASLTVVDLDAEYEIDASKFASKGKNTPFDKEKVFGEVLLTIVNGKIKFRR